jgi:hypothetical protein
MNIKCKNCNKGSQFIICECGYDKDENVMTTPTNILTIVFGWFIFIAILMTLIKVL